MKKPKNPLNRPIFRHARFSKANLAIFICIFAVIGGYLLLTGHAAGTAANLWVDANGGTCARSSSPSAYNDATACSFSQAYTNAQQGDLVLVKSGSYSVAFTGTKGADGGSAVDFQDATPYDATITDISFGATTNNITLENFEIDAHIYEGDGFTSPYITFKGDRFFYGKANTGAQVVNLHTAQHWTFDGNTFGPWCCSSVANNSPEAIRLGAAPSSIPSVNDCTHESCYITIKNSLFQYIGRTQTLWPSSGWGTVPDTTCSNAGDTCHMDAIHVFGAQNVNIQDNRFYGVECQAIFFEQGGQPTMNANVNIIGNAISTVSGGCGNAGIVLEFASGNANFGGTWNVAFNSGSSYIHSGDSGLSSFVPGSKLNFAGNYMNNQTCDASTSNVAVTYSYNLWLNASCGGATNAVGTTPAFIDSNGSPDPSIDVHLASSSGTAIDYVPASFCSSNPGLCPASDIDGDTRPQNGSYDAGADEYVFPVGSANIFMSTTGSDTGSNCKRFATPTSNPAANTVCSTMAKAISLAQPGDIIQLEPGSYGNLTVDRQTGNDSPKVIIRGDPNLPDQQKCVESQATFLSANPVCPHGNVLITNLDICGHGVSVQDMDTTSLTTTFYVGGGNCSGTNMVTANHDIEIVNSHFTYESTLRGHDLLMSHTRIGPNESICAASHNGDDGDNLHIWPESHTTPWTVPYNITIDHSLIYDARLRNDSGVIQPHGCGWGAHTDLIQTLGYSNITFTNNIMWGSVDAVWQDGVISGTTMSGNNLFENNFFGPSGIDGGLGNGGVGSGDSACSTAHYTFINNTKFGNISIDCPGASANSVVYGNYISYVSADTSYTCGGGSYDYNVFGSGTNVICGSHAKKCAPAFQYTPSDNSTEVNFAHGWDLHLSSSDTCLVGAGNPTNFAPLDFDGQSRVAGSIDAGADAITTSSGSGGGGSIQGDLNNDGHVTILDLSILLSHYGQSATSSQGDINSDGTVTILDLSILLSHYGT